MSGTLKVHFFDTHANIKELMNAGFTEKQAEAQTKSLTKLVNVELATKKDLKELELSTKRDLKELELKIEKNKNEILKWMTTLLRSLGLIPRRLRRS